MKVDEGEGLSCRIAKARALQTAGQKAAEIVVAKEQASSRSKHAPSFRDNGGSVAHAFKHVLADDEIEAVAWKGQIPSEIAPREYQTSRGEGIPEVLSRASQGSLVAVESYDIAGGRRRTENSIERRTLAAAEIKDAFSIDGATGLYYAPVEVTSLPAFVQGPDAGSCAPLPSTVGPGLMLAAIARLDRRVLQV